MNGTHERQLRCAPVSRGKRCKGARGRFAYWLPHWKALEEPPHVELVPLRWGPTPLHASVQTGRV